MHKLTKNISENKFFLPALIFTILVLVVSLIPLPDLDDDLQRQDKTVHILLFLSLFLVWNKAFPTKKAAVFLLLFFYGMVLEILQTTLPVNRSFDWYDIIADAVGLITGWSIVILYKFFKRLF